MKNMKNMKNVSRMMVVTAVLSLSACGMDNNKDKEKDTTTNATIHAVEPRVEATPAPTTLVAANASALPTCTSDNQNQLVYLKDVEEFRSCEDSVWAEISIKGVDGKDGAAGDSGMSIASIWQYTNETQSLEDINTLLSHVFYGQTYHYQLINSRMVIYTDGSSEVSSSLFCPELGQVSDFYSSHFNKSDVPEQVDSQKVWSMANFSATLQIKVNASNRTLKFRFSSNINGVVSSSSVADLLVPMTQVQ